MLGGVAAACAGAGDRSTIWPPPDFEVQFEEFAVADGEQTLERRFRVRADGLALFAEATAHVEDPETGTTLPVWTRLAAYDLVPTCTRALARRMHRAGVRDLEPEQGQQDSVATVVARLRWQAFQELELIRSRGRVHGAMAEILAILAAHLPPGERFETPGVAERGLESVLRGVPEPRDDAAGALAALLALQQRAPEDPELVLDAFALACHLGRREVAERLIERWSALVDSQRAAALASGAVGGEDGSGAAAVSQPGNGGVEEVVGPAGAVGPTGGGAASESRLAPAVLRRILKDN